MEPMSSGQPRTRTLVEFLGVIGVIGSLVFVGLEIRQNAADTSDAVKAAGAASLGLFPRSLRQAVALCAV